MDEIKKPEHLKKYIEKTKYRMFVPLVILNYPFRWLTYGLDKVAFLKILEYVSLLGVIVAVYFYVSESSERLKEKHYQAWQVINAAQGKPGSGGRIDALQDLNKDKVSLAGVDVSNGILTGINLEKASMAAANLSGADLFGADLSGAELWNADLSGAKLKSANLSVASMADANLSGANIESANLSGAFLVHANLFRAYLAVANLSGAMLWEANLSGAKLESANLSGANLWHANLSGANLKNIVAWRNIESIELANIYMIENPPKGFIEWAKETGAVSIENENEWKKLIETQVPLLTDP